MAKVLLCLLSISLLLSNLTHSANLRVISPAFIYRPGQPSSLQVTVQVAGNPVLAKGFWLGQNYPNPFNLQTVIEYVLDRDCQVKLIVYDVLGRKVRTLVDGLQRAGYNSIRWNITDDRGNEVSSGVYLYRIDACRFSDVKKMVVLK